VNVLKRWEKVQINMTTNAIGGINIVALANFECISLTSFAPIAHTVLANTITKIVQMINTVIFILMKFFYHSDWCEY